MNIEQERAEFEAWWDGLPASMQSLLTYEVATQAYDLGRAALQSKPIESAAREIALWAYGEVGADPELTPGLAQLLHHFGISDDVPVALQSQTRKDPSEWLKQHEALMYRVSKAAIVVGYGGTINCATAEQALENEEKALLDHARTLQSQDREDAERLDWLQQSDGRFHKLLHITSIVGRGFSPTNSSDKWFSSLREAIDHARCVEGDGK